MTGADQHDGGEGAELKPLYVRSVINSLSQGMVSPFTSARSYLTDYLTMAYGLAVALQIVYVVSAMDRTAGAALHFTLKETLKK